VEAATRIEQVYTVLQFAGCRPKQSSITSVWLRLPPMGDQRFDARRDAGESRIMPVAGGG
jgi:hypothetical protein